MCAVVTIQMIMLMRSRSTLLLGQCRRQKADRRDSQHRLASEPRHQGSKRAAGFSFAKVPSVFCAAFSLEQCRLFSQ